MPCPSCRGTTDCPSCLGSRWRSTGVMRVVCRTCEGSGECRTCDGTGQRPAAHR